MRCRYDGGLLRFNDPLGHYRMCEVCGRTYKFGQTDDEDDPMPLKYKVMMVVIALLFAIAAINDFGVMP